ncbi:hypothetical protein ACFYTS_20755 [Nocardia sp. NPDC004151]|uniref:hypothetical protein n=1 Tax=Nocardia sp. NPDC004151 TaxID=3364304 RepID=UPI0036947A48
MTDDSAVSTVDLGIAIQNLHDDLAAWLGSEAELAVFERFAAAQDPGFTMVSTDGSVVAREALLAGLRTARNAVPGLRIEIDEVVELNRVGGMIVVRFLEVHHSRNGSAARRVTAVLTAEPDGYLWHSVHETAIN